MPAARRAPTPARARVLLRELEALAERLAAADVRVVGALRPGMLATAIRVAFDPWSRPGLARLAAADPDRDGIDEAAAWPLGTEDVVERATERTAPFHATYWIASWPRIDVGAAFLSPLLLHAQMVRAIAVTIEPISPLKAIREVEAARTSDVADRELRGRMGFIETARRQAPDRGRRPPRGGARRRPRRRPLRRLRHRLRAHRSTSSSATARRSSTPPRWRGSSCSASTASRRRRSRTRCRSAGGCGEGEGPARAPRRRPRTSRPRTRSSPRAGSAGRGVYIGRDVYGGSFCYDPWELYGKELTSPNAVVIGIVGRAKSSLVKTYVLRQAVFGRQAWIVDVKGEYDRLAEALGVQPIALSPGGRSGSTRSRRAAGPSGSSTSSTRSPRPRSSGRSRPRRSAPARRRSLVLDAPLRPASRRSPTSSTCSSTRPREMADALAMDVGEIAHVGAADGVRARPALQRKPARACSTARPRRASTSTRRSSSSTSAPSSTRTRRRSGS